MGNVALAKLRQRETEFAVLRVEYEAMRRELQELQRGIEFMQIVCCNSRPGSQRNSRSDLRTTARNQGICGDGIPSLQLRAKLLSAR